MRILGTPWTCRKCIYAFVGVALLILGASLCTLAQPAEAATLSWTDRSTNEMGFEIERAPVACTITAKTFAKVGDVGVNAQQYIDSVVVEGQAYCWRVRAWNTVDGTPTGTKQFSSYSNEAGMVIPFGIPVAPGQLGITP